MRKFLVLCFIVFSLGSCCDNLKGVSPDLALSVNNILDSIPENRAVEFKNALKDINPEYREGLAFLIAYMPSHDLDTLSINTIVENVNYAYKAKEVFPWTKELPNDIFLNDVLPYIVMDETRENWRPKFYDMLYPLVKDCKTIEQAIDTVNKSLVSLVNVQYNTARKKPNQSPSESMSINMASCSGLSILLTDAFRAVGIPSRIAGTPLWISKEGNHNWSEVWINGEWFFTEYYYGALNHSWFLPRAASADKTNPIHWIYATSFKPTGLAFPMVWAKNDKSVPGVDVTDEYIRIYKEQTEAAKAAQPGVEVAIKVYKEGGDKSKSSDRVAVDVKVLNSKGEVVGEGKSTDQSADMNDYLMLKLPFNETFTINFSDKKHTLKTTDQDKMEVILYI